MMMLLGIKNFPNLLLVALSTLSLSPTITEAFMPPLNGEDACENRGFNEEFCLAVGDGSCCHWNEGHGQCYSSIGQDICPGSGSMPPLNGEQACENRGYNEEDCLAVGDGSCCHWNDSDGQCWSSIGQDICPGTGSSNVCDALDGRLAHIESRMRRIDYLEEKLNTIDWKVDALMNYLIPKPTISVASSEVDFGSEIVVTFDNPNPVLSNWIGIYNADEDDDQESLFWSSMCGSQEDWDEPECPPQASGSITFAAEDPSLQDDEQWPPSPGLKKVCLLYDDHVPFLVCEQFTINPLPDDTASSSTVQATQTTYGINETISVDFTVPLAIQNTWIGVYRFDDVDNSMAAIPEPLAWMYTACNNVDGDQTENNDCAALATSGTVDIDGRFESNKWVEYWPLSPDTYRACLSFYNNEPYEEFICSEVGFDVSDSAVPCVDRTDTWEIKGRTRSWCTWLRNRITDEAKLLQRCGTYGVFDDCPVLCQNCP